MALSAANPTLSPSLSSSKPSLQLPLRFQKFHLPPSLTGKSLPSVSCTLTRDPAVQMEDRILQRPDSFGRYGKFGGKYVPETLMYALSELETAFRALATDEDFQVRAVHSGTATLKDATSEARRDWVTKVELTHYILGSVTGPHPYPMMVREFHAVIGKETRRQAMEKWGGKPDVLVACVGGGSNAIGLFHVFIEDTDVRLIGMEAAGFGLDSGKHAATLTKGEVGVLHGAMSYLLQDDVGQIIEPHSISAGLDYPGVGPEHSFLKDIGRAEYYSITDQEALEAFKRLSQMEGIIPALETSHALAYLEKLCPTLPDGTKVVLNCSGREIRTSTQQ